VSCTALNSPFSRNAAWYQYNDEVVTKIKSLGAKPVASEAVDAGSVEDVERYVLFILENFKPANF
jgi:hypothetical protein